MVFMLDKILSLMFHMAIENRGLACSLSESFLHSMQDKKLLMAAVLGHFLKEREYNSFIALYICCGQEAKAVD